MKLRGKERLENWQRIEVLSTLQYCDAHRTCTQSSLTGGKSSDRVQCVLVPLNVRDRMTATVVGYLVLSAADPQ